MEDMQQKREAWKVLHHLYTTYKEINSQYTHTKRLSHSYPLSHAHHTAKHSMSQKQQRNGTENLHEYSIEMKPTSLDHLTCLRKSKHAIQGILLIKVLEFLDVSEEMT